MHHIPVHFYLRLQEEEKSSTFTDYDNRDFPQNLNSLLRKYFQNVISSRQRQGLRRGGGFRLFSLGTHHRRLQPKVGSL